MPNRMIMQKFYDISKKEKRFKLIYQSDGKPFKQFHKSTIQRFNRSTNKHLHH